MRLSSACTWALLLSTAMLASTKHPEVYSDCGGVLTDLSGRIINYVGPNTVCESPCSEEYLQIENGPPGCGSYGKFCEGFGVVYRSSSNVMTIEYSRSAGHPVSFFHVYYYGDPDDAGYPVAMVVWCLRYGHKLYQRARCSPLTSVATPFSCPPIGVRQLPGGKKTIPNTDACLSLCLNSLTCENEQVELLNGPRSLGIICQVMFLFYGPSSNHFMWSSRNASHQSTVSDAYYFSDSQGPGNCGDHLKHTSDRLINFWGPKVVRVWSVYLKPSEKVLEAYPVHKRVHSCGFGTIHDQTAFSTFTEGNVQQVV
ncbi:hypothetical protein MC885_009654 [Smutsia gigantea]|nr:hypothetical protein MC885_009654 [Smutsia gigantea]